MSFWRRKPKPMPEDAVRARVEAEKDHEQAVSFLTRANSIADSLKEIRQKNHIAEALQVAHRRTP